MKYTPENIVSLEENEVFVFGSNATGFHGAGASGFACRNDARNTWRQDNWFLDALNSPQGSTKRIGKWAVVGVSRGLQAGNLGLSYAIETIKRPGLKRSTPLSNILDQIRELSLFAKEREDLTFLVTKIGSKLAGYTEEEIRDLFIQVTDLPKNVILPMEYEFRTN